MMDEESVNSNDIDSMQYFKILVYKRIMLAVEKEKDIYYLPNFDNDSFTVSKLLNIKNILDDNTSFKLLLFHNDFNKFPQHVSDAFEHIDQFSSSQILKDY